jgi:uncharacterized protein (TIGR01244 family)
MKNETTIAGITVGGQPDASEIAKYATIINVRQPNEDGNVTEQLVEGTGKTYVSVPFTIDTLTKDDVAKVKSAIEEAGDGPILLHCMLGMRAATVAALATSEIDGTGKEGTLGKIKEAGLSVEGTPYGAFIDRYFE